MTDFELVVLSRPPDGVTDDAYNEWYETHVREILALPGFVAARRSALEFVSATTEPPERFTFLTIYEIKGPFEDAWRELRTAVDGGHMTFAGWFKDVRSQGWRGTPIGGRVSAA